eukprot:8654391-Karenia_brevis.AAC.1
MIPNPATATATEVQPTSAWFAPPSSVMEPPKTAQQQAMALSKPITTDGITKRFDEIKKKCVTFGVQPSTAQPE